MSWCEWEDHQELFWKADDNCSESENNEEDAMENGSKSVVNSGETLAMFDKLQVFLEENDVENEVLRSLTSLTQMLLYWPPRITMKRLLCVILSFAEILTGFWSSLYKADTFL